MFARVEQDVIRDLEDPDLTDERRLALMFIAAVRHLHRVSAPLAFEARRRPDLEEADLSCVSCDKILRTPSMYCSDRCRDVAKHIRYIRKIIFDERITVPELQESIGARLLYLGSGGSVAAQPPGFPFDPDGRPVGEGEDIPADPGATDRMLGDMAFRVASPAPLRSCDDWRTWEARQRDIKCARRSLIEARLGQTAG